MNYRVVDLTQPIATGMPVFPGGMKPRTRRIASLEIKGYEEHAVSLTSHTGTHIDAPAHIIAGGRRLGDFALDRFIGPACLLDFTDVPGGEIGPERLEPFLPIMAQVRFAILHTNWSRFWGQDDYFSGFPALSSQAARVLAGFDLWGVGVDTPSVDMITSIDLPVHQTLFKNNILVVENLTNLGLLPSRFTFACLPLPLASLEGSPVRAAGIIC